MSELHLTKDDSNENTEKREKSFVAPISSFHEDKLSHTSLLGVNVKVQESNKKTKIQGSIIISSTRPLIFKQIYLEIYGIAECEFPLDSVKYSFPKFYRKGTKMTGNQQFFFIRRIIERLDYSEPRNTVVYNFNFGWPNRLPYSWVGDYGNIKYLGKTILVGDKMQHVHVQEIPMFANRRLSMETNLDLESRIDIERKFTFGKNGFIRVSFWMPVSGVAIGQGLPVVCSIDNQSKLHFSGLVFVLTRIDEYRSDTPLQVTKEVRTDVCRVARLVHVLQGKYYFYAVFKIDENIVPTNQFYKLDVIHIKYEVWVSVQGNFESNGGFGYPNIDTPGIPIIIGTEPIVPYNINIVTEAVLKHIFYTPKLRDWPMQVISEAFTETEVEVDEQTEMNLMRQFEEHQKAITEMIDDSSEEDEEDKS